MEIGTWFGSEDRGGYGKHFGPVYSVKRNPFHVPLAELKKSPALKASSEVKFFLSVGDWCGKMWMEELKGPILQTPYYPAFISAAAWSPTRAGAPCLALCSSGGAFLPRSSSWLAKMVAWMSGITSIA